MGGGVALVVVEWVVSYMGPWIAAEEEKKVERAAEDGSQRGG
jgi:hypothetical protein